MQYLTQSIKSLKKYKPLKKLTCWKKVIPSQKNPRGIYCGAKPSSEAYLPLGVRKYFLSGNIFKKLARNLQIEIATFEISSLMEEKRETRKTAEESYTYSCHFSRGKWKENMNYIIFACSMMALELSCIVRNTVCNLKREKWQTNSGL